MTEPHPGVDLHQAGGLRGRQRLASNPQVRGGPPEQRHVTGRVGRGDQEQVPDPLVPQVAIIEDVLAALGVPTIGVDGYEADDVIGTIATHSPRAVDVVTGDRDLFQLVDDARAVRILYIARGVGRHEVVDEAFVTGKYAIPGRAYADFATLRGDPSDGLPGVAGVGEKTAAALVTKYGSLEGILAALDSGDTGMPAGTPVFSPVTPNRPDAICLIFASSRSAPLPPSYAAASDSGCVKSPNRSSPAAGSTRPW